MVVVLTLQINTASYSNLLSLWLLELRDCVLIYIHTYRYRCIYISYIFITAFCTLGLADQALDK